MYYALFQQHYLCSLHADLPGEKLDTLPQDAEQVCFLFAREPGLGRDAFAVTHPGQLFAETECTAWLDQDRLPGPKPLSAPLPRLLAEGRIRAVNHCHPRWRELLTCSQRPEKKRLHIIAMGDIGSTLLLGLRLLGGDILSEIGIFDLSQNALLRWEFEGNQIFTSGLAHTPPEIKILREEELFHCDMLVFCATKGVPPLGSGGDVRLAQFQGNSQLVSYYAACARKQRFQGIFAVVSDPVDLLCKVAFQHSNQDENGKWDAGGLFSEQVEGYGLGVMYARAAYYAKKDARFSSFLQEGAAFGPHGEGLVIANSLQNYDDNLSRALTLLATRANLEAREKGFKPYVAPALSSAAYNILDTLRGKAHHSATLLGDVFFGACSTRSTSGIQLFPKRIPPLLYQRIEEAADSLRQLY